MTRVCDLGEFGLIAHVAGRLAERLPVHPSLLQGIGDDAALWQPSPGRVAVLTTDTMIEGIHFTRRTTPWRDLGWKSLAVNVSDLAAMAAEPRLGVVTLGLTGEEELKEIDDLYDGMADLAGQLHLAIAGGDTIRSPQVQVGFTVVGEVDRALAGPLVLRRDAARPGDVLAVTGTLGDAAGGLELLLQHDEAVSPAPLLQAHRRPQPRVTEARWLLSEGVRCATDNSDGLLKEVELLCAASGTRAVVDATALPISESLRSCFGDRSTPLALSGGEDYELVLSVPADRWPALLAAWRLQFALPLTMIGDVTEPVDDTPAVRVAGVAPLEWGFDHFRTSRV